MTMKQLQRKLLDARTPTKIYDKGEYLAFRCRRKDRHTVMLIIQNCKPLSCDFRLHWLPLMPWECRSLLKVISYM